MHRQNGKLLNISYSSLGNSLQSKTAIPALLKTKFLGNHSAFMMV